MPRPAEMSGWKRDGEGSISRFISFYRPGALLWIGVAAPTALVSRRLRVAFRHSPPSFVAATRRRDTCGEVCERARVNRCNEGVVSATRNPLRIEAPNRCCVRNEIRGVTGTSRGVAQHGKSRLQFHRARFPRRSAAPSVFTLGVSKFSLCIETHGER